MTLKERAKLAMEQLSKQKPVTLEEAKEQVSKIKARSSIKFKKRDTK